MEVQFIEVAGQKLAVMPEADFRQLMSDAEDLADIETAKAAGARRVSGEEYVPIELVDQLMDGIAPLRVWRKYRGMTLDALSAATGVRQSLLSQIENGQAQGKPIHWRKLAEALRVTVDDILPLADAG